MNEGYYTQKQIDELIYVISKEICNKAEKEGYSAIIHMPSDFGQAYISGVNEMNEIETIFESNSVDDFFFKAGKFFTKTITMERESPQRKAMIEHIRDIAQKCGFSNFEHYREGSGIGTFYADKGVKMFSYNNRKDDFDKQYHAFFDRWVKKKEYKKYKEQLEAKTPS